METESDITGLSPEELALIPKEILPSNAVVLLRVLHDELSETVANLEQIQGEVEETKHQGAVAIFCWKKDDGFKVTTEEKLPMGFLSVGKKTVSPAPEGYESVTFDTYAQHLSENIKFVMARRAEVAAKLNYLAQNGSAICYLVGNDVDIR